MTAVIRHKHFNIAGTEPQAGNTCASDAAANRSNLSLISASPAPMQKKRETVSAPTSNTSDIASNRADELQSEMDGLFEKIEAAKKVNFSRDLIRPMRRQWLNLYEQWAVIRFPQEMVL